MYERFYGLQALPFELTANPRFLYLTPRYREALSNLAYGITGRKGITLLIGEAGTGKSTLVRAILDRYSRDNRFRFAYVNNPALSRDEFLATLTAELALSPKAGASKPAFLLELRRLAVDYAEAGGTIAIVMDEAQSLPGDLLEEIRLLSNVETPREKLVQVVMTGQPELAGRLNEPSLRQLKQRVALRCTLSPLASEETTLYVANRIQVAGGQAGQLFTREAVMAIHEASRGIPRLINVIADNALVTGFAAQVRPVGREIVQEVCADFDLEPSQPVRPALRAAAPDGPQEVPQRRFPAAERPAASQETPQSPVAPVYGRELFSLVNRPRFAFFRTRSGM